MIRFSPSNDPSNQLTVSHLINDKGVSALYTEILDEGHEGITHVKDYVDTEI